MYIMYCRSLQKGGQSLQVDVYSHVQFTISEVSLFCLVFFSLAGSSSSFCVSLWPKHGQLAYVEQCYMNNIVWKQHCISWLVLQSEASLHKANLEGAKCSTLEVVEGVYISLPTRDTQSLHQTLCYWWLLDDMIVGGKKVLMIWLGNRLSHQTCKQWSW